jgi:predicted anti-sigma-YlaC factor YlaD
MANECDHFEELISAEIDGELRPGEKALLRRHVASCASCRAFASSIGATSIPKPQHFERNRWLRAALFGAGVALFVSHVPDVFRSASDVGTHVVRHQAAFTVGLAIVFMYTSWRPDRAYGLLPVTATLGAVLVLAVVIDVIAGNTELAVEGSHLLELLGLGLAGWLGWEMGPGPRRRTRSGDESLRVVE